MRNKHFFIIVATVIVFAALALCVSSFAQATGTSAPEIVDSGIVPSIPADLATKPINEWQLNAVTIIIVIQVLGRAFASLKSGGGLVGVWRSLIYGSANSKPE